MRHFNQWSSDDIEIRFLAKVDKTHESGCHIWNGNKKPSGYGYIRYKQHRTLAHRVAMILAGYDVDGFYVLHKCNNPTCVNPSHLYLGDHADNMADMADSGVKKGEHHPMSRLTANDVLEIRRLRESERIPMKKLAGMFGISAKYVEHIVYRKRWTHI